MLLNALQDVLRDIDENGKLPEHPKLETLLPVGSLVANETRKKF